MSEDRIICPVCNKDLTEALKLLNSDFSFHRDAHTHKDISNIFVYLARNKEKLPKELKMLLEEYDKNLKILCKYEHSLVKRG